MSPSFQSTLQDREPVAQGASLLGACFSLLCVILKIGVQELAVLLTEGRRLSRMAETSWDRVREREGRETIVS